MLDYSYSCGPVHARNIRGAALPRRGKSSGDISTLLQSHLFIYLFIYYLLKRTSNTVAYQPRQTIDNFAILIFDHEYLKSVSMEIDV